MQSVEKNDIDISKLFNWGAKFPILDSKEEKLFEVYIRLVGDAELNRAKIFALRKSAELRRKLKDEDSDERLAFIPDIDSVDKDQLVSTLLIYNSKYFTNEAVRNVNIPLEKEPDSDASLEDQETYQKWVDEYPEKRETLIREYVTDKVNSISEELSNKDKETLFNDFVKETVNQLCENEMVLKFKEMCTFLGCFKDQKCKEPFFESFEQLDNLPKEIKDQFVNSYLSLEIGGEDLKKLLEAMQ